MISSAHVFDLGIKLARIIDNKNHRVDLYKIKQILEDERINIIDYLENDYGHIVQFDLFYKDVREEFSKLFRDRILVDVDFKWGIHKDGIVLLLAIVVEFAIQMATRDNDIAFYSYKEFVGKSLR